MSNTSLLKLTVHDSEEGPRDLSFSGPRVTVGKAPYNNLVLISSYVSRHHGEFFRQGEGWFYRDLRSTNGTKIEGEGGAQRLRHGRGAAEVALKGGERLYMGNLRIDVHVSAYPRDTSGEHVIHSVCNPVHAWTVFDVAEGPERTALRLLFDTVHKVSSCTEPIEVLGSVAKAAFEAIPAITHVFLFERDCGGEQRWLKRWSSSQHGDDDASLPFSQTLLEHAIERGESLRYSTLAGPMPTTESLRRAKIASTICVPLRGVGGYLGVLQADCRRAVGQLMDRDLHLMTLLGEQVAVMLDRMRITRSIQRMFEGFVEASVRAIESRDPSTAGHSARVATYCVMVAEAMNRLTEGPFKDTQLTEMDIRALRYAALLHDFGKVGVKESILSKAHKLSEEKITDIRCRFRIAHMETRARMAEDKVEVLLSDRTDKKEALASLDQRHAQDRAWLTEQEDFLMAQMEPNRISPEEQKRLERLTEPVNSIQLLEPQELEDMLGCRGSLTPEERRHIESHAEHTRCYLELIPWSDDLIRVPEIAGSHHEKLNGTGYPMGIGEQELSLETRILSVCDIYDALTASDRPYRTAMTPEKAVEILLREAQQGCIDLDVLDVLQLVLEDDGGTHVIQMPFQSPIDARPRASSASLEPSVRTSSPGLEPSVRTSSPGLEPSVRTSSPGLAPSPRTPRLSS